MFSNPFFGFQRGKKCDVFMVMDKMMQKHFMKKPLQKRMELLKNIWIRHAFISCWNKLCMNPKKEKERTHSLTFPQRCVDDAYMVLSAWMQILAARCQNADLT